MIAAKKSKSAMEARRKDSKKIAGFLRALLDSALKSGSTSSSKTSLKRIRLDNATVCIYSFLKPKPAAEENTA
jgi:hypothetical protein